jgi:AcrR family transcriptional regulator
LEETKEVKTSKGEQTKALIVENALEMFRERGYEETTMRAIAERAGVALGNAYYYFRSKEHLIQAFYSRLHEEHLAASRPVLDEERKFKNRLLGTMRALLDVMEPYHQFAAILFRSAADPRSPLNPFSPESEHTRLESISLYTRLVEGSKLKVPEDLGAELPFLLWLYQMGIILFWIHDPSPGRVRTRRLIEESVELVAKLVTLASLPLMRPLRRTTLRLLTSLRDQ